MAVDEMKSWVDEAPCCRWLGCLKSAHLFFRTRQQGLAAMLRSASPSTRRSSTSTTAPRCSSSRRALALAVVLKKAGAENMLISAVNVFVVSFSVRFPALHSVQKCIVHHSVQKCVHNLSSVKSAALRAFRGGRLRAAEGRECAWEPPERGVLPLGREDDPWR